MLILAITAYPVDALQLAEARRRTVGEVFGSEFTQGIPVRRQRRGQSVDRIRDRDADEI